MFRTVLCKILIDYSLSLYLKSLLFVPIMTYFLVHFILIDTEETADTEDASAPTFETTEIPMDYLPKSSATLRTKLGIAATFFTGNLDRVLRIAKAGEPPLQINYLVNTLEFVSVFTVLMYGTKLSHNQVRFFFLLN